MQIKTVIEISSHHSYNVYHEENKWQEMMYVEKEKGPFYTVSGNIIWCSHYGYQYRGPL